MLLEGAREENETDRSGPNVNLCIYAVLSKNKIIKYTANHGERMYIVTKLLLPVKGLAPDKLSLTFDSFPRDT